MQTAITLSLNALSNLFGVAMIAPLAGVGSRSAWLSSKPHTTPLQPR